MAYKARTLAGPPNQTDSLSRKGPPRKVAGVSLTGSLLTYSGEPPEEMLADDTIDVQTMRGSAWPGSTRDRNCTKKAHAMRIRRDDGKWPDEQERIAQAFAEKKLADPEGVARAVLKAQGLSDEKIELHIARARGTARGFEGAMLALESAEKAAPKRGPGRPRKGAED